jgi:hypothetical protein
MTQSPFDLTKFRSDTEQLKGLSPEDRAFALNQMYQKSDPFSDFLAAVLKNNTIERTRELVNLQKELDKDRMREAGKYKALFDLPNTLINAYSVPSRIQAQGAADIAQMMSQGAQNIPQLTNYQRGSFNFSPNRYF